MSTFGEMEDRIADDLNRTDLSTQIRKAINRAFAYYKKDPFWFTETSSTFTLSSGAVSYGSSDSNYPNNIQRIAYAKVLANSSYYELKERSFDEIQNLNPNTSTNGRPLFYALWQNKIWFDKGADYAYPVTLYYTKSYPAYTDTTSSNDFTTYAEDLIEARSRWWINSRVIKDREAAADDKEQEAEALQCLREETENQAQHTVEPTCF